ncbi:MAG: FG-GAP repeat protein, partial [Pseudomonadales bacterium]
MSKRGSWLVRLATTKRCVAAFAALLFAARLTAQLAVPTPSVNDTDGDGIPNLIESAAAFLDPGVATDATLDENTNGFSNVDEYRLGTLLSGSSPLNQQNPHQKVFSSDAGAGSNVGRAAALDGDWAALGAPLADCDGGGTNCGAVYIYRFEAGLWLEKQAIKGAVPGEFFGASLAMQGDTLVIGATEQDISDPQPGSCFEVINNCSGAARVFTRNVTTDVWNELEVLRADDGAAGDEFGASVAISGSRLLIGAPSALGNAGAGYIFEGSPGSFVQTDKLQRTGSLGFG